MNQTLQQLIGVLNQTADNHDKTSTYLLTSKLSKASKEYPEDQTLGMMLRVVSKMADNQTDFISKGQLKELYNKLYSRNTKFAELFGEELGLTDPLKGATYSVRDDSTTEIDPYGAADQVLANALSSMFDGGSIKNYSQKLAKQAEAAVNSSLDAWNLKPSAVSTSDGNDRFVIVRADYETPKGITSFYVPVEVNQNQVCQACMFMGNSGVQELNHTSIKNYLTAHTGNKLKLTSGMILQALTQATSEDREITSAELAVIRLNASRQTNDVGGIIGQNLTQLPQTDVALPKAESFDTFEKQFASVNGQAQFHFGEQVIKASRDHIVRQLHSFGYQNPQINIGKIDHNTLMYSVSLQAGRVAFNVPVKIQAGKIVKPEIVICNGSVNDFSQEGIEELCRDHSCDSQAAAIASPLHDLTTAELLSNIRFAMKSGNHAQAEDALNVLATMGDDKASAIGFSLFMTGLSPKVASAPISQCSRQIKNASSQHPICSHTGLPLHKVYQDKDGNCRPTYRQGMEDTYEGAIFNNSKIFG
jgi:hypothetical protein